MTPEGADRSYRNFLTDSLTVTRNAQGSATPIATVTVPGRMLAYKPEQLRGDIMQGDQNAIILASELISQGFPVPLLRGDLVIVQGRTTKIQTVDSNTRKVGTTVIAYDCQVRGS